MINDILQCIAGSSGVLLKLQQFCYIISGIIGIHFVLNLFRGQINSVPKLNIDFFTF